MAGFERARVRFFEGINLSSSLIISFFDSSSESLEISITSCSVLACGSIRCLLKGKLEGA